MKIKRVKEIAYGDQIAVEQRKEHRDGTTQG